MATASNLDDLLQCPICLDILHDPKVLDCQHTFCANCLKIHLQSTASRRGQSNTIICPNCRVSSNLINNSVDSLPGNYIVRDIIERQYGQRTPERPPGYAQQIQDRIQKMRKEEEPESDFGQYIGPAIAGLFGIIGGLVLAKGVQKIRDNSKK
ncbi:unnamed protein product [Rotaria magnacalcarata]|uniref:RING-type domain-containing protein n=2 Tax=Rotaria magnacalcarata TaxID=392030 RepID=A0A815X782_9BILA|nr:unnamed protein product [Rotaria magnacalcarata]CAF2044926.1 unnamed protein product [Rotaria magnacalcarata]CAF2093877.1 unnamed protein product [Rotaria magnacalcarata]CAF3834332.1 unnamed protein product [Rotaria magnacalcarata]CAF4367934.1 unnamed protein product [Rotaria magnacalcarata]